MRAGLLRHRVTIKRKSVTRDAYGAEVITWTDVATVWADIRPLSGREYLDSKQTQAEISHRISMRNRTDVSPAMRVIFGSRTFEIEDLTRPFERKIELRLMCRELLEA